MQADDPRHGTYAGYIAHRNEGSDKCAPCRLAERRYRKRYELNKGATMTRLGEAAHAVILRSETMALARETGVSSSGIRRLKRGGPDTRVRAETRAAIEAAATVSLLGARRRLQALAVLGWSLPEIAKLAGIHQHNLGEIRNGNRKHYCRAGVADRIAAAYDELHMRLPEPGRGPTWTRQYAARHGWVPPLAWDDIDNPDEKPAGTSRKTYRSAELVAEWEHLRRAGVPIHEAARRLGRTPDAIEQAVLRVRKGAA